MRRRALVAAAMLVPALTLASTALAHGTWMHRSTGRGDFAILHAVGLTDDQKAQIRQIFANHRSQLQTLHQQLRAAERLQIALEIRGVLTPEQLARAAQIRQQLEQLRQQERTLLTPAP
ncbi:MAG TPA: hypothetical protein VNK50_06750 [Calidithermus sp.]|nr:hypothetical protein [Calidithermus sp.]